MIDAPGLVRNVVHAQRQTLVKRALDARALAGQHDDIGAMHQPDLKDQQHQITGVYEAEHGHGRREIRRHHDVEGSKRVSQME